MTFSAVGLRGVIKGHCVTQQQVQQGAQQLGDALRAGKIVS
jgi:hypothetical protein